MKKLFTTTLLFLLLALFSVEISSWIAIYLLRATTPFNFRSTSSIFSEQSKRIATLLEDDTARLVLDANLGWRYRAGFNQDGDRINTQGLRATKEYDNSVPPGKYRLAAFGDSFTYCNEVSTKECWTYQLEERGDFEVLNYGVGGCGFDQSTLRYQLEGELFNPQLVLFGFTSVMLRRNSNVYRRFISDREYPLLKPRAELNNKNELSFLENSYLERSFYESLLNNPSRIKEIAHSDKWYNPLIYSNFLYDFSGTLRLFMPFVSKFYRKIIWKDRLLSGGVFNTTSSHYSLTKALMLDVVKQASELNKPAYIIFFTAQDSIINGLNGNPPPYQPLLKDLSDHGVKVIDFAPVFLRELEKLNVRDVNKLRELFFMPGGHYSKRANELVSREIERVMKRDLRFN